MPVSESVQGIVERACLGQSQTEIVHVGIYHGYAPCHPQTLLDLPLRGHRNHPANPAPRRRKRRRSSSPDPGAWTARTDRYSEERANLIDESGHPHSGPKVEMYQIGGYQRRVKPSFKPSAERPTAHAAGRPASELVDPVRSRVSRLVRRLADISQRPLQDSAQEPQDTHVPASLKLDNFTSKFITRGRISAGGHPPSRLSAAGGTDQKTPLCDVAGDDE